MRLTGPICLILTLAVFGCAAGDADGGPDSTTADGGSASITVEDAADLPAFAGAIPDVDVPELDREMALTLVAMPLSCLDRPHDLSRSRRSYLDTISVARVPGFEDDRAFYGCWDWHSAVNSTWTLVRILKEIPDIPLSGLIDEKLNDHLSEDAMAGELAYFENERSFERPYGWAWLLYLDAELRDWDHADAETWSGRVTPLATVLSERMIEYLEDVRVPSRSGAHSNTAFALAMMLDAARSLHDYALQTAIDAAARRLFGSDLDCPTGYEPWGSDFLSPCLEEAALMAAVLDQADYLAWLNGFLPPLTSRAFRPLTSPTNPDDVVEAMEDEAGAPTPQATDTTTSSGAATSGEEDRKAAAERRYLASTSHLIGLAFTRADAMNRIAAALPAGDPRIEALHTLARLHASKGFDALFEADYAGSHWIGTFALKYLLTER